ncbi:hypothetical protein [Lishizhenia sp.]|uniref:hypothetical protein n=1 Tax=Lishizhenia sp. TaxID=2497594 RepID=UPI00299D6DAD|nr:hypothetical protein [Lishizhenia sp.]MDX1445798.1 hypothetical protein [Lishizhenia sp.]
MRNAIPFFMFLLTFASYAQNTTLKVELFDEETESKVKNAALILELENEKIQASTNAEGFAYFNIGNKDQLVALSIKHYIFKDTVFTAFDKALISVNEDTLLLRIDCEFDGLSQEGVTIFSNKLPDTVYGSKELSVADFELIGSNRIILLAYEKKLKKGSQIMLYENGEILSTVRVPNKAEKLIRDFRGNIHIQCAKIMYTVYVDEYDAIKLGAIDKSYYFKYISPIVDTVHTKMYFSNYNPDYPAMDYMYVDKLDTTYKHLLNIEDELMMDLYTSEYLWVDVRTKLWAMEMESKTGIDKRIWVGANYFTQSIYYEEIYAPMFMRNDSLFVFDHYKEYMYVLNDDGEKLDSMNIYYHLDERQTGWEKLLLQDHVTGQVYSIYEKMGYTYIKWIDPNTGMALRTQKLHFRYVDKLEIRDNKIYYIYRPFESTQKKFLYEEDLIFDFEAAKVLDGDQVMN